MLQKWKSILTNWVNCYFIESDVIESLVNLDVLLSIISHLRENLSLDESKSSLLEAHTVEEFIHEKFPGFLFTNGTVEAHTEDELYMVASLLLFFVCVNSKDIDIKSAMCNKLSTDDQEVILKFSKCLMECSPITYKDVQTAITDACRPDSMIAESSSAHTMVSETPPALRSLHGEVRRLQAALEAERFDRNYLQEELARTNLRVEKLSNDKEQYKQDIVNLKAKISMCCGQESEGNPGDKATEGTAKLMKELQETEERLVDTQGQLDEALYERDSYKTKVNELKQERDKWLDLSQQEAARVIQLSEELTVERRHVLSLKELVEELRQHRQLNRMDSSLLECDDPDASVHSLPHNSSICSEACANVVEVQLSEERAKIVLLQQQIQSLQEQLTDLTQKSETEILTLNTILSEKDNDIFNLKHRINEEIEAKNKLATQYSDENSRLNNEINELEQKLKANKNQHRIVLESKMQDIQTLQEEKLSLLQSLNDETTKLEDLIKNLKSELATERDAKFKLKEDYNNHIMELNEKVLNRNNELVELQNNVFEKSDQIESLHLQLRKEKQKKEDVIGKYHNELELFNTKRTEAESVIQQKNEEIKNLMDRLNHNYNFTEGLNREVNILKENITQLTTDYSLMEESKNSLVKEIGIRDDKIDIISKETDNIKNILSEEKSSYEKHKNDYEAKIIALRKTIEETRQEILRQKDSYTAVLESRARDIHTLQQENQSLVDDLNDVKYQLELKVRSLEEKLIENENLTEKLKNSYECQIENLNGMVTKLTNYLKDKTSELDTIKKEKERLQEIIDGNNEVIKTLEEEVMLQKSNCEKLINEFESERLVLKNMITVTESVMEDQRLTLNETISNNVKDIEALKEELKDWQHKYATEKSAADIKLQENKEMFERVIKDLSEERNVKEKLELNRNNELVELQNNVFEKSEQIASLHLELRKEKQTKEDVKEKYRNELELFNTKRTEAESLIQQKNEEIKNLMQCLNLSYKSTEELNGEVTILKENITQLTTDCSVMEETKNSLIKEIEIRDDKIDEISKETDNIKNILNEQRSSYEKHKNDYEAKIIALTKTIQETRQEMVRQKDSYTAFVESRARDIETLQQENQSLVDDVKYQLEFKVHSLEEKLFDNENSTEKLKNSYECQIENLNVMVTKLTNYLKDKTAELDTIRKEKECLVENIDSNNEVIKTLEEEVKLQKSNCEKLINEFESERLVLKNMITVTESVMEDQRLTLNETISNNVNDIEALKEELKDWQHKYATAKAAADYKLHENKEMFERVIKDLSEERNTKEKLEKELENQNQYFITEINKLKEEIATKNSQKQILETQYKELTAVLQKCSDDYALVKKEKTELANKVKLLMEKMESTSCQLNNLESRCKSLEQDSQISRKVITQLKDENKTLKNKVNDLKKGNDTKISQNEILEIRNSELERLLQLNKEDLVSMEKRNNELKIVIDSQETEHNDRLNKILIEYKDQIKDLESTLDEKHKLTIEIEEKLRALNHQVEVLTKAYDSLEQEKNEYKLTVDQMKSQIAQRDGTLAEEISKLKKENTDLIRLVEDDKKVITQLKDENEILKNKVHDLMKDNDTKISQNEILEIRNSELERLLQINKEDLVSMEKSNNELKIVIDSQETEYNDRLNKILIEYKGQIKDLESTLDEKHKLTNEIEEKVRALNDQVEVLTKAYNCLEQEKNEYKLTVDEMKSRIAEEDGKLVEEVSKLKKENTDLISLVENGKKDLVSMEKRNNELKIVIDSQETEYNDRLNKILMEYKDQIKDLESTLDEKHKLTNEIEEKVRALNDQVEVLTKAYNCLEQEKNEYRLTVDEMKSRISKEDGTLAEEISKLKKENKDLICWVEDDKKVILNLEEAIKKEKESNDFVKLNLGNKCSILQEYQTKAEKQLEDQEKEIDTLQKEIEILKCKVDDYEKDLKEKEECIKTKDERMSSMQQQLLEEKENLVAIRNELDAKEGVVSELKQRLNDAHSEDVLRVLRNEEWVRAVGQRDAYAVAVSEKTGSHKYASPFEKDYREYHHQVDYTTSDLAHSSMDSIKTISDLEKIIHDKNRTITTLQSDITYMKTLVADSENKLLDVTRELEISKENCQQLSNQLKKIVHQKNEEIAELKKHVNKMSITENRASQIIKVSAKYQAIILKRISEIKSNAVLKELTNLGNATNGDNELRRSLNAGTITMEDLENFLETTDKHLRRCSEKQIALQKERDRLTEVNRINESEIINLKKFLTELSVSFKTFSNVKDLYTQKLSRVVSIQRTVRREILSLDGRVNDATMCKLERGYAAIMQDLSECVMNLERWVERSISRTISTERIKQAFSSDDDRASLASTTFQNTSLEVQLEELESSFQKLLEEVVRAQKGEGAKDTQSVTVMEVRAEYEDKLNRMKAKMKELYQEQMSVFQERQRHEIATLERELMKTREKLAESSKAYEEHIRSLTTELWRVGEKFLSQKDELDWERRKQRSGSLMSLQHVHSSGLVPLKEDHSRISDAHSLRSLPIHNTNTNKREGRGLHMSDEEGEVFDNRCLKELATTPRARARASSPARLSELRWRNSLCPPHLKSSYPAETQFAPNADEEHIKCMEAASLGGRNQRKEVGITAYKKPGPPTPSKQAGRLSATDSELRESLRPEPEQHTLRKTSTPSRLLSLFRSNKNDTAEGTPRKRLSMFRKKL
ncbi:unnamed protein product [Chilo suppressalis]|uniref:HOOK N-terminal domain-containing protein n=1 Tax=Chilo suppressalis TaxID=168631 RepID=A0ABN8LCT4_CHISP|nr:unnamed protein product [Chilo suppressalis]